MVSAGRITRQISLNNVVDYWPPHQNYLWRREEIFGYASEAESESDFEFMPLPDRSHFQQRKKILI